MKSKADVLEKKNQEIPKLSKKLKELKHYMGNQMQSIETIKELRRNLMVEI